MVAEQIFTAYETDLRVRRVSETALREYRITTTRFVSWLREQGMDADDVRGRHVQQFLGETGWAPSTQRSRLTWLRSPFIYAYDELEMLERYPLRRVKLERPRRKPIRTIPTAVLRQVKADTRSTLDAALFACFAYTGMRRMEVGGLQWEGVSFADGSLTFVRKGGDTAMIPMHPEVAKALKAFGPYGLASPWVFPGQAGGPMSFAGLDKRVHTFLPRPYTLHDFRHTVASSLEHNDVEAGAIHAIMGWSVDNSVRLRHYTAMPLAILYRAICRLYADDPV